MSSSAGARVSSDRIARADTGPRPGRPVTGWLDDESLTAQPRRIGRTEEEKLRAAAEDALEELRAARGVAKYTMLLAHGCAGPGCRKRRHGADAAFRDEVLSMLRLKPGA